MSDTLTQAEVEALVEHASAAMAEHESYIKEQGGVIISRGIMPECISALTSIHAENGILRTEKHADAEAICALQAELDAAITRAEEAEKARDEWCEVSQKNYQLARDMEKRLIDTAQPTD